jgi:hypothetical protein
MTGFTKDVAMAFFLDTMQRLGKVIVPDRIG